MNVIITGASKGIGRGIATFLARNGYAVALLARSVDLIEQLAKEIRGDGGNAIAVQCDVGDEASVKAAVKAAADTLGGIDALINNAGIVTRKPIADLATEEWRAMVDANVHGPFFMTRAALPYLVDSGAGRIINISSISGKVPLPGGSGYAATKYALTGLSQSLFLELREENITVTTVYPGSVDSASHRHDAGADHSWKVQPEEVGQVCHSILSMRPGAAMSEVEIRPLRKPK